MMTIKRLNDFVPGVYLLAPGGRTLNVDSMEEAIAKAGPPWYRIRMVSENGQVAEYDLKGDFIRYR